MFDGRPIGRALSGVGLIAALAALLFIVDRLRACGW